MSLRASFLSGERVYLRAMQMSDKEHATAWFQSPYPINTSRAEEFLKESHQQLEARVQHLIIARDGSDEIAGSARIHSNGRHADIRLHTAPALPDGDQVQADALRLLVPWLHGEIEHLTVTVQFGADLIELTRVAEELGMRQTARFRQFIARPDRRVDQLIYQIANEQFAGREKSEGAVNA